MTDYRLFGLWKNPFTLHSLDAHLERNVDIKLAAALDEIKSGKREKAVISLCGFDGYGKTETLRILEANANRGGINALFLDACNITTTMAGIVKRPFLKQKKDANIEKAIVSAMNKHKPSVLLFDNLHDSELVTPLSSVATSVVNSIFDKLDSGMIVFSCSESHAPDIPVVELPPLTDEEAILIVGQRLALLRYSQNIDPLYPFSRSFIRELNRAVGGNPGILLERLDDILKEAAEKKIPCIADLKNP